MLCQICNKNPATIHVQEIINGEKKVFHLCGECASKKAETEPILQSFNLAEMLYNFTNEKAAESADAPEDAAPAAAVKCGTCGTFPQDRAPGVSRLLSCFFGSACRRAGKHAPRMHSSRKGSAKS